VRRLSYISGGDVIVVMKGEKVGKKEECLHVLHPRMLFGEVRWD
jgi:hypothetical protein